MRAPLGTLLALLLTSLLTALLAALLVVSPSGPALASAPTPAVADRASIQVVLENAVVKDINTMRVRRGCRPLAKAGTLHVAARRHSNLMARRTQLSHRLAGEATLSRRVRTAGYTRATLLGEVLAVGPRTSRAALRAWMNSPQHKALLTDCRFRHVGTGVTASRDGRRWWTVDLARR